MSCTLVATYAGSGVSYCAVKDSPIDNGKSRTDTVTATYSGDSGFTSAKATATIEVTPRTVPTVDVSCHNIDEGVPTECDVTVGDGVAGANNQGPSGLVSFTGSDGTFHASSCALPGGDDFPECSVVYTPAVTGKSRTDTVTASYAGDGYFAPATATGSVSVTSAAPLSLSCANTDEGVPTSCTVTAYVGAAGAGESGPTGSVSFTSKSGTLQTSSCSLPPPGEFPECSVVYTPAVTGKSRTDTVTASYAGDGYFAPATATGSVSVTGRAVALAGMSVECPNAVETNQTQCVGILTSAAMPDATGTVSFSSPNGTFTSGGSCTIGAPVAASKSDGCSVYYVPNRIASGATRTDTVTATYAGDTYHLPATAKVTVKVTVRPTPSFTMTCSPATVHEDNPTQCTMTSAAVAAGGLLPSGTVQMIAPAGTAGAPCTLAQHTLTNGSMDVACAIAYTPKFLTSGTSRKDTVEMNFEGDQNFHNLEVAATVTATPSPAPTFIFVCGSVQATLSTTCTVFSNSPEYNSQGQLIGGPSGTVAFTAADGTIDPTCALAQIPNEGSECQVTYTPTGNGSASRVDKISASYSGDPDWHTAAFTTTVPVPALTPSFSFACETPEASGDPVTCTAEVQAPSGDTNVGPPTGSVDFTAANGAKAGKFSPTSCKLAAFFPPFPVSQCTTTYTSTATSLNDTLTATYEGAAPYAKAVQTISFATGDSDPDLDLACGNVSPGTSTTCTLYAYGAQDGPLPQGKVTFTVTKATDSGKVTPATCTLTIDLPDDYSSCTTNYTSNANATVGTIDTVNAAYTPASGGPYGATTISTEITSEPS